LLNQSLGDLLLADIKNEAAKQLIAKMRTASLSEKTMVNYFQGVRAIVASAVSSEGEQLYPRNWNFQFIGLPRTKHDQTNEEGSLVKSATAPAKSNPLPINLAKSPALVLLSFACANPENYNQSR
jgi:hypothetical protein